ncbi:hypothetical protein Tco_1051032 [Tanacetum coccineum]
MGKKEDDNVTVKESFYSYQEKLLGVKSFTRSLESCHSIPSIIRCRLCALGLDFDHTDCQHGIRVSEAFVLLLGMI